MFFSILGFNLRLCIALGDHNSQLRVLHLSSKHLLEGERDGGGGEKIPFHQCMQPDALTCGPGLRPKAEGESGTQSRAPT